MRFNVPVRNTWCPIGLRRDKKPRPEPFKATTPQGSLRTRGQRFRKDNVSEVWPHISLGASSVPNGCCAETQVGLGSQTTLCLGRSEFMGEKISQGAKKTLVIDTWVLHMTL